MFLRHATYDDLEAVSGIYAKSWKHAYRGIVPQAYLDRLPEDFWIPFFSQRLDEGVYSVIVAEQDNTLLGCIVYGPSREESHADWGEICSIYVLPSWMGKGVGHLLLQYALQKLQRIGFTQVFLWVLEENTPSRRFYERHGFSFGGDRAQLTIEGVLLSELRYVWRKST